MIRTMMRGRRCTGTGRVPCDMIDGIEPTRRMRIYLVNIVEHKAHNLTEQLNQNTLYN